MPDRIRLALTRAISAIVNLRKEKAPQQEFEGRTTLEEVERILEEQQVEVTKFLAESALEAFRARPDAPSRTNRDSLRYLVATRRAPERLVFTAPDSREVLRLVPDTVLTAIRQANRTMETLHDLSVTNGVPIFHLLGMRNLSSFVGEVFARELQRLDEGRLRPNPHQDGHPDLLALTADGRAYIAEREARGQLTEKDYWSPYPYGGIEVKATCGNTPPAKERAKPEIGESRIPILESAEWKAHHQDTNNLIGLFWDFVDGLPTVLAAFYRNDLTRADWGNVIVPREGSRTTSVSIMPRGRVGEERGVKKMGKGWLVLPDNTAMIRALKGPNVFGFSDDDIRSAV